MNLVWTSKSNNTGNVELCSAPVARMLIDKGLAVDMDQEKPKEVKPKTTKK
jgi:hypothetical protein